MKYEDPNALYRVTNKLLDSVARVVGAWYKPSALRETGYVSAAKKRKAASPSAEEQEKVQYELEARATNRVKHLESRRQANIESILEKTETLLTAAATGELIDIDWGSRFFQKAQDISEKEMQGLWASVLASQIRYPGVVSLHTLEVLGNLSKREIDIFATANCLVSGHQYIWKIDGQDTDEVDAFGLSHKHITILREVGLIQPVNHLSAIFKVHDTAGGVFIPIEMHIYLLKKQAESGEKAYRIPNIALSRAGQELSQIIEPDYKILLQYGDCVKEYLAQNGYVVRGFD